MKLRESRVELGIQVTLDVRNRMLTVAEEQDIDKGGYCDARSGCVNFWCGPEDKPACWDQEIKKGGEYEYPRDYVGGVYFKFNEDTKHYQLYLVNTPYMLLDQRFLSHKEWEQVDEWVKQKTLELHQKASL